MATSSVGLHFHHRPVMRPATIREIELAELGTEVRKLIRTVDALPLYSALVLLFVGVLAVLAGLLYIAIEGEEAMRIVALIVALLMSQCLIVRFAIAPIKRQMLERASTRLAEHISSEKVRKRLLRSWWGPTPGAISLADSGCLLLLDDSTGYELRHITPGQISLARVHVIEPHHPDPVTRQLLQDAGYRVARWYTWPHRQPLASGTFLEIRYSSEHVAGACFALVPFGADLRSARVIELALET